MIDVDNMKKSLTLNFEKEGIDFELLSIGEADKKNVLDRNKDLIVIQKSDIIDERAYPMSKKVIQKFFN